jgi:hypothetical protein
MERWAFLRVIDGGLDDRQLAPSAGTAIEN